MTITLHCTHCNQSMAIAPRKPGSRVDCPSCGRSVVVPAGDPTDKPASPVAAREVATARGSSRVSESPRASADRGGAVATVLPKARTATTPAVSSVSSATRSADTGPRTQHPTPALPQPELPFLPQPAVGSPSVRSAELPSHAPARDGVVLPKSVLILLIVFALAALGVAFFAGFLFGKQTATQSRDAVTVETSQRTVSFAVTVRRSWVPPWRDPNRARSESSSGVSGRSVSAAPTRPVSPAYFARRLAACAVQVAPSVYRRSNFSLFDFPQSGATPHAC
jgi:hypothetical protein